jgi:VIT1/CCC1 family predicted Fe2+/Mn2+ transporter
VQEFADFDLAVPTSHTTESAIARKPFPGSLPGADSPGALCDANQCHRMPCGIRLPGLAWLFGVFTAVYPDVAASAPATALVTAAAVSGLAVAEGAALDGAWGPSRA